MFILAWLVVSAAPVFAPARANVVVVGYVADVRETGKNEALFWNVKEGQNAVTLTAARGGEKIDFVCVWDGAPPARLKEGLRVRVEGEYYGRTVGGARVYAGCRLKE